MPANYKQLISKYDALPAKIKGYLPYFKKLVYGYPYEVTIGYLFSRIERAHHIALDCGLVKLHECDSDLTDSVIQSYRMTREDFPEKFKTIFDIAINPSALVKLRRAEKIRDRLLHGKSNVEAKDQRHAIFNLFEYFEEFDTQVTGLLSGFSPFGSLTGLTGRKVKLGKSTTRWVLKGMGFSVS